MTYYCEDCGSLIEDWEIESREPREEDGVSPWQKVAVCPVCGSDDVSEAERCERCGRAVVRDERFCEECVSDLDDLVLKVLKDIHPVKYKAAEILFDFMEERSYI